MNQQITISCGEFLDRFYYYGFLALYILLAVTLTGSLPIAIKDYGLYTTFGFSLPIILGYFADRWSQHYPVTVLGLLLFMSSFSALAIQHSHAAFILSSALLLLGVGCFKSNNLKILVDHHTHQSTFNLYYALMSTGSILGPLCAGYYYNHHVANMAIPFFIITTISTITFLAYIILFKNRLKIELQHKTKIGLMLGTILLTFFLIVGSYYYDGIYDAYILAIIGIVIVIFKKINDRTLAKKLLALLTYSSIFFITEMIATGILLLYIKNNLGTHLYALSIPPPYFMMFFSLVAVVFAVTLSRYLNTWEDRVFNFHYYKLLLGGFCGVASMWLLLISKQSNENVGIMIILTSMFFLGLSDFLIVPSIFVYLAKFSTEKIKSSIYSLWLLSVAFSGYLSVKLFDLCSLMGTPKNTTHHYLLTFFLSGLLLLLILPFIRPLKLKVSTG